MTQIFYEYYNSIMQVTKASKNKISERVFDNSVRHAISTLYLIPIIICAHYPPLLMVLHG